MSANLLILLVIHLAYMRNPHVMLASLRGVRTPDQPAVTRQKGQPRGMTVMRRDQGGLAPQLAGYRLTTAEILYHMPDHPAVLQSFVWQDLDMAPRFPVLHRFLEFWRRNLDGRLHSVRVGAAGLITPGEMRFGTTELRYH